LPIQDCEERECQYQHIHANWAYKLNICNISLFCKYQQNKKEQKWKKKLFLAIISSQINE